MVGLEGAKRLKEEEEEEEKVSFVESGRVEELGT